MERDDRYRPDNKIRDVYDSDFWDTYRFEEQGLSPFVRIGSLQDDSPGDNNQRPKQGVNMHRFTFVGPLTGARLNPYDRNLSLSAADIPYRGFDASAIARKAPFMVAAFIAYLSQIAGKLRTIPNHRAQKGVKWHRKDYAWVSSVVPTVLTLSALGLIAYAAIAESPAIKPHGGHNGAYPYSKAPTIIDNRNPFPLKAPVNSAVSSSSSSGTAPAASSSSSGTGSGSSAGSSSAPYSGYSPAPATGYGGGGYSAPSSGATTPTSGGTSSSTSSTPTSTSTTSPTSTNVPGVTSPTTTTIPGTSLTNPLSGKQVVGTSPTSLTLN